MKKIVFILMLSFFSLFAMQEKDGTVVQQPMRSLRDLCPLEIWQEIFCYMIHDAKNRLFVLNYVYREMPLNSQLADALVIVIYEKAQQFACYEAPTWDNAACDDLPENDVPIFFKKDFQYKKMQFLKNLTQCFATAQESNQNVLRKACEKKVNEVLGQTVEMHYGKEDVFGFHIPEQRTLKENIALLMIAGARIEFDEYYDEKTQKLNKEEISTVTFKDWSSIIDQDAKKYEVKTIRKKHPKDPLGQDIMKNLLDL